MEGRLHPAKDRHRNNHDFYQGAIAQTRSVLASLAEQSPHLDYLTTTAVNELTPNTVIIGHDGWPDARLGDYDNIDVILNDHLLIAEIARWYQDFVLDRKELQQTLMALADEAAGHFERTLAEAVGSYPNIIAVTHVPPFREAAWYQGNVSDDDYLPYFASKSAGEAMCRRMQGHAESNLLVLCGHTHGGGELQVLDNLLVLTGEATYGNPEIRRVIEIH